MSRQKRETAYLKINQCILSNLRNRIKKIEKKGKWRPRNLWDTMEGTSMRIVGVLEGEEGEEGAQRMSEEIMAKNAPSLIQETK